MLAIHAYKETGCGYLHESFSSQDTWTCPLHFIRCWSPRCQIVHEHKIAFAMSSSRILDFYSDMNAMIAGVSGRMSDESAPEHTSMASFPPYSTPGARTPLSSMAMINAGTPTTSTTSFDKAVTHIWESFDTSPVPIFDSTTGATIVQDERETGSA